MNALTIRLPDNTTERLKSFARSRGQSVSKLVAEMSAQALLCGIQKFAFVILPIKLISIKHYRYFSAWIEKI